METTPEWPNTVFGIDFSGAADAGRRIWISRGVIEGGRLQLEWALPAEALPGSGQGRAGCLTALRAFIAEQGACAIGLDLPFGLPAALTGGVAWEDFLLAFADRYDTPEAFRDGCCLATGGRELKRRTDREARTPFAAYNLRLYRQTYFGVRDLLAPLVREGSVCVLPMQPARPDSPWLLEICPASSLKRAGLYRPYKGPGEAPRAARNDILEALENLIPCDLDPALASMLRDNVGGDALDSAIAAIATFTTLQAPHRLTPPDDGTYAAEGYVYI